MNEMEPFEQRLKRQPLRPVPADWRKEILSAAKEAQPLHKSATNPGESLFSCFNRHLASLLWPHPIAWGGLAAVWIFIFVMNASLQDKAPAVAEKAPAPSPAMLAELRQQQRMFAELIGPTDLNADRPKNLAPQPRSERVVTFDV